MIFLAPFHYGKHGASLAPHTILGIRNGQGHYHKSVAEIPVHPASALETSKNIAKVLSNFENQKYLVIGGDHSITEGVIAARSKKKPVHVVLFDAHTDDYSNNPHSKELEKHRPLHAGNWLARGIENGNISGVTMFDGNRNSTPKKYRKPIPKDCPVHLSVDIDVLSVQEIGMATEYPEPGGYSLTELVEQIASLNLQGRKNITADITEYDPTRDVTGAAGWCCAKIVGELLTIIGA